MLIISLPVFITRSSGRQSALSSLEVNRKSQSRLTSAATIIIPPEEVREKFKRVNPLKEISSQQLGWTLDVLNVVRRLVDGRRRGHESLTEKLDMDQSLLASSPPFTTADVYAFTRELEKLHPDNSESVRDQVAT